MQGSGKEEEEASAMAVFVHPSSNYEDRSSKSLSAFLERNGLSRLEKKLHDEGFASVDDVLCLTPRKFDAIGIEGLGTRLRFQRVIETAATTRCTCTVRVSGNPVKFCLNSKATLGDLHDAVSAHVGVESSAFTLVQQTQNGKAIAFSRKARVMGAPESSLVFDLQPVAATVTTLTMTENGHPVSRHLVFDDTTTLGGFARDETRRKPLKRNSKFNLVHDGNLKLLEGQAEAYTRKEERRGGSGHSQEAQEETNSKGGSHAIQEKKREENPHPKDTQVELLLEELGTSSTIKKDQTEVRIEAIVRNEFPCNSFNTGHSGARTGAYSSRRCWSCNTGDDRKIRAQLPCWSLQRASFLIGVLWTRFRGNV